MSFPLPPGGLGGNANARGGANNVNNDNSQKKSNLNPTSIDAMFQGILPAASPATTQANARQQLGSLNLMASSGGMVPSARLSQTAVRSHPNSLNSNLGEEIKRLQQLHQLNNANAAPSASGAGANQLMQGLLAQRANLGVTKNPARAAQQASMLQSLNPQNPLLSQRDAATFLLMSQQQQQQQQQQQAAALQQQQTLQQQLAAGLVSPAQLMAQQLPSPSMLNARAAGGMVRAGPGAIEPFPEKLMRMLKEVELSGKGHIISFVDDGRAFAIHKPNQFFKVRKLDVMRD